MKKPIVLLALLALFGSSSSFAATVVVRLVNGNLFEPQNVTLMVGETVQWMNDDSRDHTSTSGTGGVFDGTWNSGNMAPGATFSYTFTASGTYDYFCSYHSGMTGSVNVVDADAVVQLLGGNQFAPKDLVIDVGQTIVWRNDDTRAHTSTSGSGGTPDGIWNSGNLNPGEAFTVSFPQAGLYPYFCLYHLPGMTGSVEVLDSQATPLVIQLEKSGIDVIVAWNPQPGPVSIFRGVLGNLTDLALIGSEPTLNSFPDQGAVTSGDPIYYYGAQ